MSFFSSLQQATFRGIPFGVVGSSGKFGRRVQVHEYPFRDEVWVEDLGRLPRKFQVRGFLLENDLVYHGDPVIQQRKDMLLAVEAVGSGQLVHPTFGTMTVSCVDFEVSESKENGQYFEIVFTFIRTGVSKYPSTTQATQNNVSSMGILATISAAAAFATRAIADVKQGLAVVQTAVTTATGWVNSATALAQDAAGVFNSVTGLAGNFGRYFSSALSGFVGAVYSIGQAATTSVDTLLATGTVNQANVVSAGAALVSSASNLATPAGVSTAAQNLASAVAASAANPSDGIRFLSVLAAYTPDAATPDYSVGAAMADIQDACGDLFRRSAVIALANMATTYQPSSSDDAVTVRNSVTALLDNEIQVAGDQGEDDIFMALRNLRAAVVQDLNTRGAALPSITTITVRASLPAPVLAQMLYRDASRADQLVTFADPPHPCFMPTTFEALSS